KKTSTKRMCAAYGAYSASVAQRDAFQRSTANFSILGSAFRTIRVSLIRSGTDLPITSLSAISLACSRDLQLAGLIPNAFTPAATVFRSIAFRAFRQLLAN